MTVTLEGYRIQTIEQLKAARGTARASCRSPFAACERTTQHGYSGEESER
jgi:hypothetical protein